MGSCSNACRALSARLVSNEPQPLHMRESLPAKPHGVPRSPKYQGPNVQRQPPDLRQQALHREGVKFALEESSREATRHLNHQPDGGVPYV